MTSIPASIDEVTSRWLSDVTGFAIDRTRVEQIGVGVGVSSAVYRVHLDGTDCPASLVVKLPALDPAAVFTATVLRMYIREVGFYEELRARSPLRVPAAYFGAVDEASSSFVIVMEDMGAMRMVDQVEGMPVVDARRCVDELAGWHAAWWRQADDLAESGLTVSLGDPVYPAVLPMVFAEGWDKLTAGMVVPEAILEVGPRFASAIPDLLADLSIGPTCMIHGDFRADNIFFAPDGAVVLLDFQLIGSGSGAYDLAYFVTQSLNPDVAAEHEVSLFNRWTARLRALGISADDLSTKWDDYRKAALFCLVYPVVAIRGMDLSDPRQRGLVDCMNERFARAVDQLALADLL